MEQMLNYNNIAKQKDLELRISNSRVSDKIKWLTTREKEFVQLCCSELTYEEITDKMNITHNTIYNYRKMYLTN